MSRPPAMAVRLKALGFIARAGTTGLTSLELSRALSFSALLAQRQMTSLSDADLVRTAGKQGRLKQYVLSEKGRLLLEGPKSSVTSAPTSVMHLPVYVPPPRVSPMRPGAEDFLSHPSRGSFKT
jgi:hypothetical protein